MERLEEQQLALIAEGRERHVLILVDDITMDYNDREQLSLSAFGGDTSSFLS